MAILIAFAPAFLLCGALIVRGVPPAHFDRSWLAGAFVLALLAGACALPFLE